MLLDLVEEHRGALEYDFRSRFHLPLTCAGSEVGWDEAVRLVRILRADPSSMLAAAVEGWSYPLARTDAILMDQYDAQRWAAGDKKWKGYPRPYQNDDRETVKRGNAGKRTPEQVKAILREQFGQPASA